MDNEYSYCTSLTSVVIPNSVTSIGHCAFNGCTSLASVVIGNSVTSIGERAFLGCTSLASVVIGNSVTNIGEYTFEGCTSLVSIEIPNSVTSIGGRAFECCKSLASVVIPNSVTSIGSSVFNGCTNLVSVVIPNSVTSIDNYIFDGCDKLSQIEVGNSYTIERIGYHAKKLIIAENYADTSLPNIKYSNYTKLDTIVCKLSTPPALYDKFSKVQYMNLVVIVPTESLAAYQSANVWKNFWDLQGGAEATAVSSVSVDDSNKPAAIYDLQGRRLKAPQKGLNIINGRKVLVK